MELVRRYPWKYCLLTLKDSQPYTELNDNDKYSLGL